MLGMNLEKVREMLKQQDVIELNLTEKNSIRIEKDEMKILE